MKEKVPFSLISKLIKAYKGDDFADTWPQIAKRYLSLLLVLPNVSIFDKPHLAKSKIRKDERLSKSNQGNPNESTENQRFLLHFLRKRLLRRRANNTN